MPAPDNSQPDPALAPHFGRVLRSLENGRVVPLLGAGVNLVDRPEGISWRSGGYLPSGSELTDHLADLFYYPPSGSLDLLRVSQWAVVKNGGTGDLYDELRKLFVADYAPTRVHRFFAKLPAVSRERGWPLCQLLVTTNYDDALERAFDDVKEPYDTVWYIADRKFRGKFWHRPFGGEAKVVERPKRYVIPDDRTVVLKIHGAVDRDDATRDSYVITEDHYIEFLAKTELTQLLPVELLEKLLHSHFLFLGYSLQDWNLRVILHRIWEQQKLGFNSWAIQLAPSEIEQELWRARGVDVIDIALEEYMSALETQLAASAVTT